MPFSFPSALYAILDVDQATAAGRRPLELLDAWLGEGVRLVQLRAKSLSSGDLLALADPFVRRCRASGALSIINDRADVAAMAGGDGVHVGQDDLSAAEVRVLVGDDVRVGRSTHTPAQVRLALEEPIDYLAIGPVFETASKATGYDPLGLDGVREAAALAAGRGIPVVAIGGVSLASARQVLEAGASAVAVISDLLTAPRGARARAYLRRLA